MNKIAAGFIAGGVIGAAGIAAVASNKKARRQVAKKSAKMAKRAGKFLD